MVFIQKKNNTFLYRQKILKNNLLAIVTATNSAPIWTFSRIAVVETARWNAGLGAGFKQADTNAGFLSKSRLCKIFGFVANRMFFGKNECNSYEYEHSSEIIAHLELDRKLTRSSLRKFLVRLKTNALLYSSRASDLVIRFKNFRSNFRHSERLLTLLYIQSESG